jgi:hypothetical protein
MGRTGCIALFSLAIALGPCLSGCDNFLVKPDMKGKDKTGTISVGFGSSSSKASKTILPGLAAQVSSISVTASSGSDSQTGTTPTTSGIVTFQGLASGAWTLTAKAYDSGGVQIGTGGGSVAVSSGSTKSVSIPIAFTGDASSTTGDLSIGLSWPVSTGASYLGWTIDGNAQIAPTVTTGTTDYAATLASSGLSIGSHCLILTFSTSSSSGAVLGSFVETVNIVAGMTSEYWIDSTGALQGTMSFAAADFFDSTATLAALTLSQGALSETFAPTTYAYRPAAQITGDIAFTLTPNADGQSISYTMDGTAGALTSNADGTKTTQTYTVATASRKLVVTVLAPDRTTSATYSVSLPLFVSTTAKLADIANHLDNDYVLDGDIDTTTDGDLTPISGGYSTTTGFSGTFDGNGHTIKYQNSTSTNKCVGLFGNIFGGIVKNLNVVCDIDLTATNSYVGGIAGQNQGTIINCSSSGTISAPNYSLAGGLVGQCGRGSHAGTISGCFSTVDIDGESSVGGLVGAHGDGSGSVASISDSYARGTVSGTSSVGGLVGDQRATGKVVDCYATGTITGTSSLGGLVGSGGGTITASYYDNEVFTGATVNGTGLTTAQMKVSTNFSGWDFSLTWGIGTAMPINGGYPYLVYFKNNTTVYD